MKNTLHLYCKTDIASLINCDVRILPDLISEKTKTAINFTDRQESKDKRKKYTVNHVFMILSDVYPFKTREELLKMLFPGEYKGV